jgi:hypothetical protein
VVFIKCRICQWEKVLFDGPREVVELELDIERLRGRVGAGQTSLASVLRRREMRLEAARRKHGIPM